MILGIIFVIYYGLYIGSEIFGYSKVALASNFIKMLFLVSIGIYLYTMIRTYIKYKKINLSIAMLFFSTISFFIGEMIAQNKNELYIGNLESSSLVYFWIGKFLKLFAFLLFIDLLYSTTKIKKYIYIVKITLLVVFCITFLEVLKNSSMEMNYFMMNSFNFLINGVIISIIILMMSFKGMLQKSTLFLLLLNEVSLLFIYGTGLLSLWFNSAKILYSIADILYGLSILAIALAALEGDLFSTSKEKEINLNYSLLANNIRQGYPLIILLFFLIYSSSDLVQKQLSNYLLITLCFFLVLLRQLLLSYEKNDYLVRYYRLSTNYNHEIEKKTEELLISEQQSKALFSQMDDAIILLDADKKILSRNVAFEKKFSDKDIRTLLDYNEEERVSFEENFKQVLNQQKSSWVSNLRSVNKEELILEIKLIPFKCFDDIDLVYVLLRDITEITNNKIAINHLAYYDRLTDLPNRLKFNQSLEELLSNSKTTKRTHYIIFFDLDKFKSINDTLGHEVGDLVLCEVANRANKILDGYGKLYRQSGDEFVGIIPDATKEKMKEVASLIVEAIAEPMYLKNEVIKTGVSIGIAQYPADGTSVEELVNNADVSMYIAKNNQTIKYQFFDKDAKEQIRRRRILENALKEAVDKEEFVLHYQPQVDAVTNEIIGVEALIRWNHPILGYIQPLDFISIAEEIGELDKIGEWVFTEVCRQMTRWLKSGIALTYVAVNVSHYQLENIEFPNMVMNIVKEYDIPPKMLNIEITGQIAKKDDKGIIDMLKTLRNHGFKISMDHFGSGYSSLSYLSEYKLTSIKIAHNFIKEIDLDNVSKNSKIIDIIILIAQQLNMNIVAEGVETQEQMNYLMEKNCKVMQGYYFSYPISSEEVTDLLRKEQEI